MEGIVLRDSPYLRLNDQILTSGIDNFCHQSCPLRPTGVIRSFFGFLDALHSPSSEASTSRVALFSRPSLGPGSLSGTGFLAFFRRSFAADWPFAIIQNQC